MVEEPQMKMTVSALFVTNPITYLINWMPDHPLISYLRPRNEYDP